jgi:hypothetical protein
MPVSIKTAAMPNKLILAVLERARAGCTYLSVDFASIAITGMMPLRAGKGFKRRLLGP